MKNIITFILATIATFGYGQLSLPSIADHKCADIEALAIRPNEGLVKLLNMGYIDYNSTTPIHVDDFDNFIEYLKIDSRVDIVDTYKIKTHGNSYYVTVLMDSNYYLYDILVNKYSEKEGGIIFQPPYTQCEIVGTAKYYHHQISNSYYVNINHTKKRMVDAVIETDTYLGFMMSDDSMINVEFCHKTEATHYDWYIFDSISDSFSGDTTSHLPLAKCDHHKNCMVRVNSGETCNN